MTATLDELVRLVGRARTMPMSSSVIVSRDELLRLLERLRGQLPEALDRARAVLGERELVVEQGRREAERVVRAAEQERDRLVGGTEVHRRATERVAAMRAEVDDYVDGRLATFEVVLARTLAAVERGRATIAGRSDLDELAGPGDDDGPLPQECVR